MTRVLGAILAGGRSRRFGSDKALALLEGRPLISHVIAALRPQCDAIILCGRVLDGFDAIADWPAPGLGPLGGLAAALRRGVETGYDAVLTVPCDTPRLPHDLQERLGQAPAFLADLPVIGLWPCGLSGALAAHIIGNRRRSMHSWAAYIAAEPRHLAAPLANLNTPGDLLMLAGDVS